MSIRKDINCLILAWTRDEITTWNPTLLPHKTGDMSIQTSKSCILQYAPGDTTILTGRQLFAVHTSKKQMVLDETASYLSF